MQLVAVGPHKQRRLTVAFRLILAIPHAFVLFFLDLAGLAVAFVGWWGLGGFPPRVQDARSYQPVYGAFPTWLTSVTRNLLVDHYRRTRRDRLTDSIDDAMPQVEEKHSPVRSPDKVMQATELSEQLQRGLARLSPELREAVILRDLQELDYNEIRTVLQVPEGTVKSRINRGRIELARVLQEMGVRPA